MKAIRIDLLLWAAGFLSLCTMGCKNDDIVVLVQPDFTVHASHFLAGDTIYFENTSTGMSNRPIQWHWDFGNGKSSAARNAYTLYDREGTYIIRLSAIPEGGEEASREDTLIIAADDINTVGSSLKPVPALAYALPPDCYETATYVGTPLKFIDRSSDDGTIIRQQWTFNGIETLSGKMVEYTFDGAGDHTVTLQVTDDDGLTSDTTFQLSVRGVEFSPWQPGYLDIHHINTGRGDASFFIFPDGTNMLFDAGDKDVPGSGSTPDFPVHPNASQTPGEWIVDYIAKFIPAGFPEQIDYMVLSHFHVDHMGRINSNSPRSSYGHYRLGGVTQVGDILPIRKIIDRAYPTYDFPVDLKKDRDDIENYVDFLNYHKANRGLEIERIAVGSSGQITLQYNPSYDFRVINLYAAGEFWAGHAWDETRPHAFSMPLVDDGEWNDNPLSIALKIEYGAFDYYTGGDITGEEDWPDYDIETPMGNLVKEVDAMAVNHHGYKDATNQNFVNALMPQVAVQQTSNNNHVNPGVVGRLKSVGADLYISNIGQIYAASAIARDYKSLEGHVVIRVYDGGEAFEVFILSDRSPSVPGIKKFGPYQCR